MSTVQNQLKKIRLDLIIGTLEQIMTTGQNESARVAAAFKLAEMMGVAKGDAGNLQSTQDFYKGIINDDEPTAPTDWYWYKLEEVG